MWLLAGTNPLVSKQGRHLTGFPIFNPVQRIREAKQRGLRLIVIDPQTSETARWADLHLRPRPRTDAVLYAGLLHVILFEDLIDPDFCAAHCDGLDELRSAVAALTPGAVADLSGVPAEELVAAARMFGTARKGMARSGTGPNMGPHSNLAKHLLHVLNIVCGRFAREGDIFTDAGALQSQRTPRAQIVPPSRDWDHGYRNHFGFGLMNGQLPANLLVDEIVQPGSDRIRAQSGERPARPIPHGQSLRRPQPSHGGRPLPDRDLPSRPLCARAIART